MKSIKLTYEGLKEAEEALLELKRHKVPGDVAVDVRVNLHAVRHAKQILDGALEDLGNRSVLRHPEGDPDGQPIPIFSCEVDFARYAGLYDREHDYEGGEQVWFGSKLYDCVGPAERVTPDQGMPWVQRGELVRDGEGKVSFHVMDGKEYNEEEAKIKAQEVPLQITTVRRSTLKGYDVPGEAIWLEMIEM